MVNNQALVKKDTVDVVAQKINYFLQHGELRLPEDYSPENALKSAWLILQNTMDKEKRPVLTVCTKESIANALLDMVVQGLNPAKRQGYFIAYGNQLAFQRSYFGTMAITKRVDPTIQDIFSEVVYEGDTFKYKIVRGNKEITQHEQSLENIDNKKIKAAYCVVFRDGQSRTEIMTFEELKQAWKQSQMHPIDEKGNVKAGSTHDKFTAEMAKKTVTNRTCKPIINSSSDSYLFKESFHRSEEISAEVEVEEEIATNANSEVIDTEFTVEPAGDKGNGKTPPPPPSQPITAQETQPTGTSEGPGF